MNNEKTVLTSEPKDSTETFTELFLMGIQLAAALLVVSLFYKGMVSGSPVIVLLSVGISGIFVSVSLKILESAEFQHGVPTFFEKISRALGYFFLGYPILFILACLVAFLRVIFTA